MNFKISTIVLPLELSEYHEAYAGQKVLVWVNPPREVLQERENILRDYSNTLKRVLTPESDVPVSEMKKTRNFLQRLFAVKKSVETMALDAINDRMFAWLNQIWSQHEDEACAWPVADIRELYDAEPSLYQWMVRRSVQMIAEFRNEAKKK